MARTTYTGDRLQVEWRRSSGLVILRRFCENKRRFLKFSTRQAPGDPEAFARQYIRAVEGLEGDEVRTETHED